MSSLTDTRSDVGQLATRAKSWLSQLVRRGRRPRPPRRPFAEAVEGTVGHLSLAETRLLRRRARAVTEGVIIEVGSFRGRSTIALSWGAREGGRDIPIYALDPHEKFTGAFGGEFGPQDRREFYANMLRTNSWENVRLINLSSEVVTPGWDKPVGMLWIDGDHEYAGVKRDFECWSPYLLPGAAVLFDDTHRGGPKQLVEELLAEGWKVTRKVGKIRCLEQPVGKGAT